MKVKAPFFLIFILFTGIMLMSPSSVFAVENEEEQYPTISSQKKAPAEEAVKYIIPTILRKKYGKLQLDAAASAVFGYDSNVNLNRYDEDGSLFQQHALGIYGKYPLLEDRLFVKGGYDFTLIKYYKFSDPDLIDNIYSAGIEAKVTDNLLWSADYSADLVGFPHDKISRYNMNIFGTSAKYRITRWLYNKVGYEFFTRHYPDWRTSNNHGVMLERDRNDFRNTVYDEVGVYLGDKTFVKADNRFYRNTSNELFLNFYDYNAYKTKVSLTRILTHKLYGTASFAYQYKAYDKRSVTDREEDQRDHLFIYGTSLYYDIIPSVAIGASFDLRDNVSNENQQKYEDYIVSSGVYAVF